MPWVHLAAIAGLVAATVVYGLALVGAHERRRAEKRRLGIECGSCANRERCGAGEGTPPRAPAGDGACPPGAPG